jgi:long-chain acyl-CoA synthetase
MERPWLKFYGPHVPPSLEYPEVLLPKILDDAADQFPGKTAVFFFGGKIQYGPLRAQANQFANALKGIGFGKGDRLGLLLANMPQSIISAFGAMKAGGAAVFFDPLADEEELQRQFNDAQVEMLVALDLILPRVDKTFSRTGLKQFIITGVKDFLPFPKDFLFSLAAKGRGLNVKVAQKPNIKLFRDFLAGGRSGPPAGEGIPVGPEEVAAIQYTRGTSGPPKGVLLTHKNLMAGVLQVAAWSGNLKKGEETFLAIAPFHQAYGMTMGMNLPIYLAAKAIHLPRFETLQVLSAIKKHHPSFFPASPSMIETLSTYPQPDKNGISSIKNWWSMGGTLPEEVLQNFERKAGRKICAGYGLTEASPLTHAHPLTGEPKAGSVGIPLPDTDARIMDPASGRTEMAVGEAGELIIKGPQVMKGYWNRPKETAQILRQGWLYTGDKARMDEDGYFYVLGKIPQDR